MIRFSPILSILIPLNSLYRISTYTCTPSALISFQRHCCSIPTFSCYTNIALDFDLYTIGVLSFGEYPGFTSIMTGLSCYKANGRRLNYWLDLPQGGYNNKRHIPHSLNLYEGNSRYSLICSDFLSHLTTRDVFYILAYDILSLCNIIH